MCKWNNGGVPVQAPEFSDRKTICVDECIVDQIQSLWAAGVVTLGCCCGHNLRDPEVIIESSNDPNMLATAHRVLSEDSRRWEILEWKLVSVACTDREGTLSKIATKKEPT